MTAEQTQPNSVGETAPAPSAPPAVCDPSCKRHKYVVIVPWVAQIGVAVILAQTLFFKFTYAPETRAIFEPLGGRPVATFVGLVELMCVVLLLIPRTAAVGAALSLGVIGGAILTHLTSLGIEVTDPETGRGDGGLLFGMALAVAVGSLVVLWYRRAQLPVVGRYFSTRSA